MDFKELGTVMVQANKEAFKTSATRRSGKIINDRLIGMVKPKLPILLKAYADTELGRFVMANLLAATAVKFGDQYPKLLVAADMAVQDAADQFLGSFRVEDLINDLLDGVNLDPVTETTRDAREAAATGLRKASDVVSPQRAAGGE
jgi:hypothetical protein